MPCKQSIDGMNDCIAAVTHRTLDGEDVTDCSFIFLYSMCIVFLRQVSHATAISLSLNIDDAI